MLHGSLEVMSLHVVIAGSSGFLGTHLRQALRERGHRVTRLVRSPTGEEDASTWDPYAGVVDRDLVGGADVVVNLAGAPLIGNVHSDKWAREVRESRVRTTRLLAEVIAESSVPPAFLAGNGIAFYGDHGDQLLTETSDSRGEALLTDVSREWEAATEPAAAAGSRVCVLRTSPVMDRRSPPMKQLVPLFKLGLGGRLGSGRQHMAMISLRDWVGAVVHLAEHDSAAGPFNMCCERTPTNAEFTRDPRLRAAPAQRRDRAGAAAARGRRQDGARAARLPQRASRGAAGVRLLVPGPRRRGGRRDRARRPRLSLSPARAAAPTPPATGPIAAPQHQRPAGGPVARQHAVVRRCRRRPRPPAGR